MTPYTKYQMTEYDWLPVVPSHWIKHSIRGITRLQDERLGENRTLELLSVYREYGVIKKSSRDDNHNVESLNLSKYKVVEKDCLVMNKMKMWQASLGVSIYDGIVSPAYIVCKFKIDANYRYLHYLLRSMPFKTQYNRISYGIRVGQWDMRYNDFKNINIYIPPRTEQDLIVKFLDSKISNINNFIKAKKREIELLKEQKQAELNHVVIKGLNPNVPTKDSGFDWLGEIPAHWDIKHLRNFLFASSIKNRPEMHLLSVVREKGIIIRDIESKEENHNYIPDDLRGYKLVTRGQFVINKMKAWQGSYGVSDYDGIVSPAYYVYNLDFTKKAFFHTAIRSKVYVNFFAQFSDGIRIGQWDLSSEKLKMIPFFLPSENEQVEILDFLDKKAKSLNKYLEKILKVIELVTEYKNKLISDVATGKIDLRNVSIDESFELPELAIMDDEVEEELSVNEQ